MSQTTRAWLGLVVTLAACRPTAAPAPPVAPSPPVAETPVAAVRTPELPAGMLLVADKANAQLHIVALPERRALAVLPTGTGPHEVAISSDGRVAAVSNYGDQTEQGHTLTVVDLESLEVVRTIDLGEHGRPHGAHFRSESSRLIVTSEVSQHVVEVDVVSGVVVRATPTEQPMSHMVALHGDGQRAFTANIVAGTVSELDLERGAFVRTMPVAPMVEAIAVHPEAPVLWVGSNAQHSVSVIDLESGEIQTRLEAPGVPIRIAFTPSGRRAVVTAAQASRIYVFDPQTQSRVGQIELEGGPTAGSMPGTIPIGIAIANERLAFVSLAATGEVAVIDIDGGRELTRLPAGMQPDGIAFTPG